MICDQTVTKKDGIGNNLAIYSYDSLDHYTLKLVGIKGMEPFSIPVLSHGDTLTYPGSYTAKGHKIYTRTLNIFASDYSYKYFVQSSKDGNNWSTTISGTAYKIEQ
ncbi:MAG: hypothetical protein M3Z26_14190 [Bacteroidota bacterium]|nr:hypothetical protein [Bacteroidota bacterium]